MVHKPTLLSYGSSYGKYGGPLLNDYSPSGYIDTYKLNKRTEGEPLEFNQFEEPIKDYVLARLGHPIVRVELTNFQIKTCIDEAITKLDYFAPFWNKQYAVFAASAGITLYELPPFIANSLTYVVYRKNLFAAMTASNEDLEFDLMYRYFQGVLVFSNFSVGEYYLLQQYFEQVRRVLGADGTFELIDNKNLQISPAPVANGEEVILEFRALNSETLHPYYHSWVQKYTLACAKGILGHVRSKFSILPGPGGGSQLNGAVLLEESTNEKGMLEAQLQEEIDGPPVFFVF